MIYLLALILIVLWLVWRLRRGRNMEEGFYTLFVPYHTDKMIKIPDYTKYIDKYRQNLLKVGIIYSKDDLYIIKFVNNLFTNVLTTALIEKLKIISKEFDYQLLKDLSEKQIDIAVVSEPVLTKIMIDDSEYINTNPIIQVNNSNIEFLTNIGQKYLFIVTLVKSGIENIQQLSGKRVGIGRKKSTSWVMSNDLLNYLEYNNYITENVNRINLDENLGLLQLYNEKIDALIFTDIYPNKTLVNMSLNEADDLNKKFRILPISNIDTNKFETQYFYYKKVVLDLNKLPQSYLPVTSDHIKYNRFNPDLITYSFSLILVSLSTLPIQTAYTLVKTIYENKNIIDNTKMTKVEMSLSFTPIEVHKGANKYYYEKGYYTNNSSKDCIYFIGNDNCNNNTLIKHGFSNPRRRII